MDKAMYWLECRKLWQPEHNQRAAAFSSHLFRAHLGCSRTRSGVRPLLVFLLFCIMASYPSCAEPTSWSARIANAAIERQPELTVLPEAAQPWSGEQGVLLEGIQAAWYNTADGSYFRYLKKAVDAYLGERAKNATDAQSTNALQDALWGQQILRLYRVTLNPQYYMAAKELHDRLAASCLAEPSHARQDSLCVAEPFLAEYASIFQETQDFGEITRHLMQWSEAVNRVQMGRVDEKSAQTQARMHAWLLVALVDSLPSYPQEEAGRAKLIEILHREAASALQHMPTPSSVRCLYVYALLKGVRFGYLAETNAAPAESTWQEIVKKFAPADGAGRIVLSDAKESDGSRLDGALLLAATEADLAYTAHFGRGETVMLDAWYNSQQRKNAVGQMSSFHYKWYDYSDSGYSLLGHIFRSYGAATETLDSAPTQQNLKKAQYYIIVSPDIPVKNPNLHYMTDRDADEIVAWVKQGGVLILFENDPPNADITHLDLLADRFGIHFDDVLHHHILGEQVEDGRIPIATGGPIFHHEHTLYMKDTCAISLHGPTTKALLQDRGDVVMAEAKYGRGTVFATVDPWLYNEYTDGRKNQAIYGQFDNFAAGEELVQWLLQQPASGTAGNRNKQNRGQ